MLIEKVCVMNVLTILSILLKFFRVTAVQLRVFGQVGLARREDERRGRMKPTSHNMRLPEKGGG